MSSALVRQALAFVDPEENIGKGKKRRANPSRHQSTGQVSSHPYKRKSKKQKQSSDKSNKQITEENIKKLLQLSTPTANKEVAQKIVERAVKGKPLAEKIEEKVNNGKSILFPEEPFHKFEKSYFCS
ncbi:unnamed protein product [Euphydryas editha]|uniref:40S ribosomal protein S19-binding protein 1 n=1 Tax=Euphydryas editha TaxID=104508 RepID=A0AAU9UHN1_EUPED|nr:unnamed protein product [Euphydryas editha]